MSSQQFIEWLTTHLNKKSFPGCRWLDKNEQVFEILWPRADKSTGKERLGIMYEWWTHKFGDTRTNDQPTAIKGNFRSCINSKIQSRDINKVTRLNRHTENEDWKAFQFCDQRDLRQSRRRMPLSNQDEDPERSSVNEWDTSEYEPHELYGQKIIHDQRTEVNEGSRKWEIEIKAMGTGNMRLKTEHFRYKPGTNTQEMLLFYLQGSRNEHRIDEKLNTRLPNYNQLKLNMRQVPLPCIESHKKIRDKNGQTKMDYFFPGLLFEVDHNLDIYITRLSVTRLHYGCPADSANSSSWVKLELLKKPEHFSAGRPGCVRQKVFSYSKFLHRLYICHAMNNAVRDGRLSRPLIEPIKPNIYIAINQVPTFETGVTASDYYFQIIHKPAESQYVDVFPSQDEQWNISEDMVPEAAQTMRRYFAWGDNEIQFDNDMLAEQMKQILLPPPQRVMNLPGYDPNFVHPAQMQHSAQNTPKRQEVIPSPYSPGPSTDYKPPQPATQSQYSIFPETCTSNQYTDQQSYLQTTPISPYVAPEATLTPFNVLPEDVPLPIDDGSLLSGEYVLHDLDQISEF